MNTDYCKEVFKAETDLGSSEKTDVSLLTGFAIVKNVRTGEPQEDQILFDTGTDRSFIQNELAEELELPTLRTSDLVVYKFGAKDLKPKTHKVTSVQLWDEGRKARKRDSMQNRHHLK